MMSNCRVVFMLAVVAAIFGSITVVYGGPVRTGASRAVKIPRAIRAPFRNNEMMTARGFGKRSHQVINVKDETLPKEIEFPWSFYAQDGALSADSNDGNPKLLGSDLDESYPIDLIVQEMVGNGPFLRSILERNVDTNHDGQITLHELFNSVSSPLNNELI